MCGALFIEKCLAIAIAICPNSSASSFAGSLIPLFPFQALG
jgi:hypothetical protein